MTKSETKLSPEVLEKLDSCHSAEDLVKLAAEKGVKLTLTEAKKYLSKDSSKLNDEELDKVSGGQGVPPIRPEDSSK